MKCCFHECPEETEWSEELLCRIHRDFCPTGSWRLYRTQTLLRATNLEELKKKIAFEASTIFTLQCAQFFSDFHLPDLVVRFRENPEDVELKKVIHKEMRRRGVYLKSLPTPLLTSPQRHVFEAMREKKGGTLFAVMPKGSGKTTLSAFITAYHACQLLTATEHPYEDLSRSNDLTLGLIAEDQGECRDFLAETEFLLESLGFKPIRRDQANIAYMNNEAGIGIRIVARSCQAKGVKGTGFHSLILQNFGEWALDEGKWSIQEAVWRATRPAFWPGSKYGGNYIILSPEPKPETFWEKILLQKKEWAHVIYPLPPS